jgi:hypothetical protein
MCDDFVCDASGITTDPRGIQGNRDRLSFRHLSLDGIKEADVDAGDAPFSSR